MFWDGVAGDAMDGVIQERGWDEIGVFWSTGSRSSLGNEKEGLGWETVNRLMGTEALRGGRDICWVIPRPDGCFLIPQSM